MWNQTHRVPSHQAHHLFELLNLQQAFVTQMGKIVGVVSRNEVTPPHPPIHSLSSGGRGRACFLLGPRQAGLSPPVRPPAGGGGPTLLRENPLLGLKDLPPPQCDDFSHMQLLMGRASYEESDPLTLTGLAFKPVSNRSSYRQPPHHHSAVSFLLFPPLGRYEKLLKIWQTPNP